MFHQMPHPVAGQTWVFAPPYRLDGQRLPIRNAPPTLGGGHARGAAATAVHERCAAAGAEGQGRADAARATRLIFAKPDRLRRPRQQGCAARTEGQLPPFRSTRETDHTWTVSTTHRRQFLAATAAAAGGASLVGLPGLGQGRLPSKPVRFIVPFNPGGATDIVARVLGEAMSKRWASPSWWRTRAVPAGMLGTDHGRQVAPLMATTSAAVAQHLAC